MKSAIYTNPNNTPNYRIAKFLDTQIRGPAYIQTSKIAGGVLHCKL